MKLTQIISACLASAISASAAIAKPLPTPTFEEAAQKSEMVVIAQYGGYVPFNSPVKYFDGVLGHYLLKRVLKGPQLRDPNLNVAYNFEDGTPCEADARWTFKESEMPKSGSDWILFLVKPRYAVDKAHNDYSTYRGDFGRLEATAENVAKIEKILAAQEKAHGK